MKKILFILTFLFSSILTFAQEPAVEMADKMREDGKIWVVVAVIFATFIGLVIYLFMIDRKISKIEKQLNIK